MNRKILVCAGVIAVVASIYVGRLWAQQGGSASAPAAEPPKTKIALINLRFVFEKYYKYRNFKAQLQENMKPFEARDHEKKAMYERLMQEASKPTTAQARREEIELELKRLKREIEDNGLEMQKSMQKRFEEELKLLFRDVHETATKYTQVNGFDLLLTYNEAITQDEYVSMPFIQRRLQLGSFSPMWIKNGLDISANVLAILNQNQPAPPATTGGNTTSSSTPPAPRPGT